jgi:hypothetical protein
MTNPSPSATFRRATAAEWIARREESIKRIGELLAERRMTICDIAEECGLKRDTARGHLVHMEVQGLAHRTGEYAKFHREYWAAGEKPEPLEQAGDGARAAPTVQVNLHRDPLVAALFGPVQGVVA